MNRDLQCYQIKDLELTFMEDHFIIKNGEVFFKVGIKEGQIIQDLQQNLDRESILLKHQLTNDDFETFVNELKKIEIIGEAKKEPFNILFIKVPLFNPTSFLEIINKLLHNNYIRLFLLWSSFLIIFSAMFVFIGEMDTMVKHAFHNILHLNWYEYVIIYLALFIISVIHEMGHAVVCRYYGGKVTYIGFLLLCFSPALYTDVSSTRLFKSKKEKIIVFLAGAYFELTALSILLLLRFSLEQYQLIIDIFVLSNAVGIITNFIPFIRLDGYWILSAATNITNLYSKSLKVVIYAIKNKKLPTATTTTNVKFIFVYGILNFVFLIFSIITGLFLFVQLFSYSGIPQWLKIAVVLFESTILTIILFQIWKTFKNGILNDV